MIFLHLTRTQFLAGSASVAVLAIAVVSLNRVQPELIPPLTVGSVEDEAAPVAVPAEQDALKPKALFEAAAKKEAPRQLAARSAPQAEGRLRAQDTRIENQALAGGAVASAPLVDAPAPGFYQDQGRDQFTDIDPNGVKLVTEEPVSTFSPMLAPPPMLSRAAPSVAACCRRRTLCGSRS